MVQLFLLKNTRNWQKFTRQINCLIYAVNLFVAGMTVAGLILVALCLIGSHTQFWTMHTIWNYGQGTDSPQEVHGKE
ncbi:hypothetical protein BED21_24150 [Escherichia coli]|nr:hypothetical protein [Escherichia coli]